MSVAFGRSRSLEERLELVAQTGLLLARNPQIESIAQRATDAGLQVAGAEFGALLLNEGSPQNGARAVYTVSGTGATRSSTFPAPGGLCW